MVNVCSEATERVQEQGVEGRRWTAAKGFETVEVEGRGIGVFGLR